MPASNEFAKLGCMSSSEAKREISTRLSPLYRWGIPAGLTLVAIAAIYQVSFSANGRPDPARIALAIVIAAASMIYARWLDRAKRVWIDTENLYVSDYRRETTIPLTNIQAVKVTTWIRPLRISIWFEKPTIFGEKIAFFPARTERDALPDHPAVAETVNR
jgi:hypothetical protein